MIDLLNNLISFIELHKNISYLLLFIGSISESLFPLSFMVYGEIFFLAGSILSGYGILNIFIVSPILIIGGFIGDNISYLLGNRYGIYIIKYIRRNRFLRKHLTEDKYKSVENFFTKKGGIGVLIARLSGPLARVTPFIAGTFNLKYKTFLKYDIAGVVLGIGTFILVGYFFGRNFDKVLTIISNYILYFIFIFFTLIFFIIVRKYLIKKKHG